MGRKAKLEGGFAYRNEGKTQNCYAAVKIGAGKSENAGFIYENKGEALHCFARSTVRGWKRGSARKKQKDGFAALDSGKVSRCFFLVKNSKKLKQYRDGNLGLAAKAAEPEKIEQELQWNFEVFERENAARMDFLAETWRYDPIAARLKGQGDTDDDFDYDFDDDFDDDYDYDFDNDNDIEYFDPSGKKNAPGRAAVVKKNKKETVMIGTENELLTFMDRVNRGEPEAVNADCRLTADLDFHGKKIPSLGCDRQHPFCGTFDGGGYRIRGFILCGKDMAEIGFFGCLKGSVYNLSVDGIIKAGNCPLAAGFCAVNEGEIHCCEAVIEMRGGRYVGMFVGENHGMVERCSVSGKSCGLFLLWLWPCLPWVALIFWMLINPPLPPEDYVPVMADAAIIPNEDVEVGERTNENKASYEVPKTLLVDAGTMKAKSEPYVIKNPNRGANYDFVAVLYMTDSAGRDVEVYRSGRIPVGYHIQDLTLAPEDGSTLAAGNYQAKMVFSFYHHDTGEKGMVDSTVPITVEIK